MKSGGIGEQNWWRDVEDGACEDVEKQIEEAKKDDTQGVEALGEEPGGCAMERGAIER